MLINISINTRHSRPSISRYTHYTPGLHPLLAGRALVKLLLRVGVQLGVGLLVAGHVGAGLLPPRHPAHPRLVPQTCNKRREG